MSAWTQTLRSLVDEGHESPQAVLDLMLDDLESDALSNPHEIVYQFTKEPYPGRSSSTHAESPGVARQPKGRCSSLGSMSLLDSMQLMELPILPGDQLQFVHCCASSAASSRLHVATDADHSAHCHACFSALQCTLCLMRDIADYNAAYAV